jgi:ribonuclease P protein component
VVRTLKKTVEFKRVYEGGRSAVSPLLVVYISENDLGFCRFGFSVSKKVGGAVVRNKVRRRLKNIVYGNIMPAAVIGGSDIIIIARAAAASAKYEAMRASLIKLVKKLARDKHS